MNLFDLFKRKKGKSSPVPTSNFGDLEVEGINVEATFRGDPLTFDVLTHEPGVFGDVETIEVVFDDDVEDLFGDLFNQLESKLTEIDGVTKAFHQDRGQFILTVPGLSEEEAGKRIATWLSHL